MHSPPLSPLDVSRTDDGQIVRVMLSGELDMSSVTTLELELLMVETRKPPVLVIDLTELRFMGVSGLRSILDAARRARREGRRLVVSNPPPHILRLFELTAIDQSVAVMRAPLFALAGGGDGGPIPAA